MSYEVRRVPWAWAHPKADGKYVPLYGRSFSKDLARWTDHHDQWGRGFVMSMDSGCWIQKDLNDPKLTFEQYYGAKPVEADYMPDWPEAERTHFQMYETITEGTPISPPMATEVDLSVWLAINTEKKSALNWMHLIQADLKRQALKAEVRLTWQQRADIIHRTVTKGLAHYTKEDAKFMSLFLAGEAGELVLAMFMSAKIGLVANLVKKEWMEEFGVAKPQRDNAEEIRMELADVRISLELLARCLGVSLDQACSDKLTICEKRWPEAGAAVRAAMGEKS